MRRLMTGLLVLWLGLGLGTALAAIEVHQFKSPEEEHRYKALIAELRCLVCQNENLANSNADLAKDLRAQVYKMLQNGATDQEIIDYMVNRYGDFVLYRPPFKSTTVALWIGPFVFLLVGVVVAAVYVRRRRREPPAVSDEAELDRVRHLLNDDETKSS